MPVNDLNSSRRTFLGAAAAVTASGVAGAARATSGSDSADSADRVVVGVMGLSRGSALAQAFASIPEVEVRYICDADSKRMEAFRTSFAPKQSYEVNAVSDFRRILDDPEVTALVCAAPNHWHAPASIIACSAGKHVYVEKPCSHNPREGELLIEAARKNKRCVQMGNQRRSAEKIAEGIQRIHDGLLGRVYCSRSWYAANRGPIGTGTQIEVPPGIDYELWQGPAPRQPYTSNRLHYNWHWVWHYGNGELGNNGIHSIDLSRWGLQVDYPVRVVSAGGRYVFDDDQQTADTHVVSFEFPEEKQISWECLSCNRYGLDGSGFGVTFHGEKGTLRLSEWGYALFDDKGKEMEKVSGTDAVKAHVENFITAMRANDPTLLNSEIEEGHKSTLLCHLGNIALRTGDSLKCDPANGHILNSEEGRKLWSRDYAPGWEPKV